MPYANIDREAIKRGAWITVPNSHYDPKKGARYTAATWMSSSLRPNSARTASTSTSIIRRRMG